MPYQRKALVAGRLRHRHAVSDGLFETFRADRPVNVKSVPPLTQNSLLTALLGNGLSTKPVSAAA
jgi:hypothetical protein